MHPSFMTKTQLEWVWWSETMKAFQWQQCRKDLIFFYKSKKPKQQQHTKQQPNWREQGLQSFRSASVFHTRREGRPLPSPHVDSHFARTSLPPWSPTTKNLSQLELNLKLRHLWNWPWLDLDLWGRHTSDELDCATAVCICKHTSTNSLAKWA